MLLEIVEFKLVLQQVLKNTDFYEKNPQLKHETTRVWLLLYDMYLRKFAKREPELITLKNSLFGEAGLLEIEKCLDTHSIQNAAALTRIRIQNSAHSLIELLPPHLQDEKVAVVVSNPIVTGWINTFRVKNKSKANELLNFIGLHVIEEHNPSLSSDHATNNLKGTFFVPLAVGKYKWDNLCPQVISIFPENRTQFIRSQIFQQHEMIIQDRSFMIGPAIFASLLELYELTGDVVQTHISSPRSTAYLASLLFTCRRVHNFLAFGCGNKLNEYKQYMVDLGVSNVKLYAENFIDVPHGAGMIERVVGVFANPPSSYSAVSDPIDLICSRGGDLSMLEILSESEMTEESKQRVSKLLVEQRETLKHCMSRPQVQIILYQTHSIVQTENEIMVEKVIEYVNQRVYDLHLQAAKDRELAALAEAAGNQLVNRLLGRQDTIKTCKSEEYCDNQSEDDDFRKPSIEDVEVPLSDQFETIEIPDFCPYRDSCLSFADDGLFLSLIKRKEVIRLDSKYLIKIAEVRGIFGDTSCNTECRTNVKVTKRQDKKPDDREKMELESDKRRLKRRSSNMDSLISRLNTPTQASLKRGHHHRVSSMEHKFMYFDPYQEWCPRFAGTRSDFNLSVLNDDKLTRHWTNTAPRARNWWRNTIRYVCQRIRLIKQHYGTNRLSLLQLKQNFFSFKPAYDLDHSKRFRNIYYNRVPYPLPIRMLELRQYNSENTLVQVNHFNSNEKGSRLSRQNAIASGQQVRVRSSQSC
ncbi:uncharacterized protein LOC131434471 isoform X2 [Malaya genurostris]|uniref:uncharacterized protein LOC131434471 isoform X2 n=1 Tax=Malaya genurostris TaxID=325434 RepID=UPI0026F3C2F0|nr:uncharacterized protein LOC131434471 isoform X2 [Malaya genurostris]